MAIWSYFLRALQPYMQVSNLHYLLAPSQTNLEIEVDGR
jgi:hypothetical protein